MAATNESRINNQAREWFVTNQSGAVSIEQRQAFERWHRQPEHQQAYARYQQLWSDLGQLAGTEQGAQLRASVQPPSWLEALRQWWQPVSWAGAAAAGLVLALWLLLPVPAPEPLLFQTAKGEVRLLTLPDGSQVTLDARSSLRFVQGEGYRNAELLSGSAFFAVARDPARPFTVAAGQLQVQVLGTQFDVQRRQDQAQVSVLEGLVQVQSMAQEKVSLVAGEAVEIIRGEALKKTTLAAGESVAGWRSGRLQYRQARLADVVADVNRYYPGEIVLGSQDLRDLRVTLALRTDQADALPELLARSVPVTLHKEAGGRLLLLADYQ